MSRSCQEEVGGGEEEAAGGGRRRRRQGPGGGGQGEGRAHGDRLRRPGCHERPGPIRLTGGRGNKERMEKDDMKMYGNMRKYM